MASTREISSASLLQLLDLIVIVVVMVGMALSPPVLFACVTVRR
jgi:hypothetical protein